MKKVKLRSMAKRLLPVMMVPVLLMGNYATITASAEEVAAIRGISVKDLY